MGYRIFITGSGIAKEAERYLKMENCILEVGDPKDSPDDIGKRLKKFNPDGLIVRQGQITGEVQNAAENLKVICKHGVGIDNIDIEAATKRGIPLMYTPQANFESTAEHAFALILSLLRRIPAQDRSIRCGIFDKKNYDGMEFYGKTLGIIGFGRIGRRLSELVGPFKVNVLVYHPSHTHEPLPPYISKVRMVEEIFRGADIISLHCPLTPLTQGMINRQTMAQMKETVCIINTARGGIVNETDLLQALENGRIGGAALDVFESEPPAEDHPIFKMDNVVLTAHVGGASDNSLKNMGMEAARKVLSVLKGEALDRSSLVNTTILEK